MVKIKMKKIVLASKSKIKYEATLNGFKKVFPEEDFQIESIDGCGMTSQPFSDIETYQDALLRIDEATAICKYYDYCVSIEGGIENIHNDLYAFAWVVIKTKDNIYKSRTPMFYLPSKVSRLLKQGRELNDIIHYIKKYNTIPFPESGGIVSILTRGILTRTLLYEQGVILSLIPLIKAIENYDLEECYGMQ